MTLFQALLLGLLGWMSSIYSPVLVGGLGGWYTLGRPLVSGFVIGIILGDIPTGIILGAAIQALYIGLVTPGGAMPADVNYASWIGIPLAMIATAGSNVANGSEYALTLAVPLSMLGVAAVYTTVAINLYFVHKQDAYVEEGKLDLAAKIPIVGQITNFCFRFFPIFLINYFGTGFMTKLVAAIPAWFTNILQIFAGMLPLVGFMLLLKMIVKKGYDMILFAFGFVLVAVSNMAMIPIVIIALVFAYIDFKYSNKEAV